MNYRLWINLNVQGEQYIFSMTPMAGVVKFDLAKIVLGLVGNVSNKTNLVIKHSPVSSKWSVDGAYNVSIYFTDTNIYSVSSRGMIINKTFVIGGVSEYKSNVPVGNTLSINNNKWDGYPTFDFKLNQGNIIGTSVSQVNRRKRIKCNDAYILFRNRLGGFSGYLFEDFEITENARNKGYYITDNNIVDQGTTLEKSISLQTKLKRRDYEVARHLIDSREVYLYRDINKLTRLVGG
ncbi:MAG TPA: hypothetical protein VK031_03885, partial [Tissierellaceae bacterium]|nr:hypothetical protein [Tissierellaceae bacterium]